MKKIIILVATVFSLCGLVNSAGASLLHIDPNSPLFPGSLPIGAAHDVIVTQGVSGWYNADLYATADVNLTYEYLGYEAGWTNAFIVDGSEVFRNKNVASPIGATTISSATAGSLLDFAFNIISGGNASYGIVNGENVLPYGVPNVVNNGYGHPNFFLGCADRLGNASCNSIYITLDDGGGPWFNTDMDDDNHDDLVIKVTATPVPEPATLLLLGSGLVGIGAFRKKFKK